MPNVALNPVPREVQIVDPDVALGRLLAFVKQHPQLLVVVAGFAASIRSLADFDRLWPVMKRNVPVFASHKDFGNAVKHLDALAVSARTQTNRDAEDYFGLLRGRLLEKLVVDQLRDRYAREGGDSQENAEVLIDGIRVSHGWALTIDAAGIKGDGGTFLEAKVHPARFDEGPDTIPYLEKLQSKLLAISFKPVVGGISLFSVKSYRPGAMYNRYPKQYPHLKWLGFEDIPKLRFDDSLLGVTD